MKKFINKIYFVVIRKFYRPGIEKNYFFKLIHRFIRFVFTPETADVFGHKMYLDKIDSLRLAINRSYEPFETDFLRQKIKKGDIVLNIGANIGYYTLIAARAVGSEGQVYAFEPEPDNFKLLKKNIEINGYENVVLINKAVSNIAGRIKLFLNEDNGGDHRIYDSKDGRKYIEIETIILDEYFKKKSPRIDFVIMDTQGADFAIFLGMRNILKSNNQLKIATEFWPFGLEKMGFTPEDYLKEIIKKGFNLFEINEVEGKIEPMSINRIMDKCFGENYINLYLVR